MTHVNHGGLCPRDSRGGDLPSDRGASPPLNFDCGGDRPRRPREVGAYELHNSSDVSMQDISQDEVIRAIKKLKMARQQELMKYSRSY